MCETLTVKGTTIAAWPGVEVYGSNGDGTFRDASAGSGAARP